MKIVTICIITLAVLLSGYLLWEFQTTNGSQRAILVDSCNKHSIENCPSSCFVGPSCRECDNIGCRSYDVMTEANCSGLASKGCPSPCVETSSCPTCMDIICVSIEERERMWAEHCKKDSAWEEFC